MSEGQRRHENERKSRIGMNDKEGVDYRMTNKPSLMGRWIIKERLSLIITLLVVRQHEPLRRMEGDQSGTRARHKSVRRGRHTIN